MFVEVNGLYPEIINSKLHYHIEAIGEIIRLRSGLEDLVQSKGLGTSNRKKKE